MSAAKLVVYLSDGSLQAKSGCLCTCAQTPGPLDAQEVFIHYSF